MKEEVRIEQFLGLPQDAASTEVKERCEALLGWLESEDIPDHLRSWAENQGRTSHLSWSAQWYRSCIWTQRPSHLCDS